MERPTNGIASSTGCGTDAATSNVATAPDVALRLDRPGAAILLEPRFLGAAVESLAAAPGWT